MPFVIYNQLAQKYIAHGERKKDQVDPLVEDLQQARIFETVEDILWYVQNRTNDLCVQGLPITWSSCLSIIKVEAHQVTYFKKVKTL